ncbi:hypothetical protein MKX01_021340 [Papaver californicum]|nr:hypothetical protein MKX01_021340 [Papaver californicum]
MASTSNLPSSNDLQRFLIQDSLRDEESNLKDKKCVVPQLGKDGIVNESNQNNLEMVLSVKEGNCKISSGTDNSRVKDSIGVFQNPKSKDWRTLFPHPYPIIPQPSMKFTPPVDLNRKKVVDSFAVDFSEGIKRCEEYVVVFFMGRRLSFPAVKEAVSKHWNLKNEVTIKLHRNGAFVFEFKDKEDRRSVLELGSLYISKSLFTLRPWSNMIESSISIIWTIPIWVLIYGVPLHMWDNEGLGLISSFIGKPLLADDCTLKNKIILCYGVYRS